MKLPRIFSKQYNLGVRFGALRTLVTNVMFYVAMVNFALISVTAYHTTLREFVQQYLPWFNFAIFITALLLFFLVMLVVEFKFVLPSCISFANIQQYAHQNPIRKDLEVIMRKLEELERKMGSKGKDEKQA